MTKVFISERQVVSIKEFMEFYVGKKYDWHDKLTHNLMSYYLREKGYFNIERTSFNDVSKEKILTGEILAVRDEVNKIIFYKNPRLSLDNILKELNRPNNVKKRKEKRKEILTSLGLVDTDMGVLEKSLFETEEYKIEKENRQRQFIKTNRYFRKKHY